MASPPLRITLEQTIHMPAATVYGAFTSAAGWVSWCCQTAEVDARPGGRLHIFTEGYNASGEFLALVPDSLVEFTWNGDKEPPTRIQVTLGARPCGGPQHGVSPHSTCVAFSVTGLCSQAEWADFAVFLERVWGRALRNLKAVLEAPQRSA